MGRICSSLLFAGPEGAAKGTAIVYLRVKDLIVAGICPESDASLEVPALAAPF